MTTFATRPSSTVPARAIAAPPPSPASSGSPPEPRTVVLKFGSSVFATERDVWPIVTEIDRQVRDGKRVVAVVSALLGQTDRLLASARRITDALNGPAVAALLATGEEASASLLSLALAQVGVNHNRLDARSARLIASGPNIDASPVALDLSTFRAAFARAPVVVFPGFAAITPFGEPALLGRGGSDLSAIFLAAQLNAEVRLIKDVDGVYERDPLASRPGSEPRRYTTIRWDEVPSVASKLVQTRAVLYARDRGLDVRVCSLGSDGGTLITSTTALGDEYRRGQVIERDRAVPPAALV
jgi:homoserine dehydrogenase